MKPFLLIFALPVALLTDPQHLAIKAYFATQKSIGVGFIFSQSQLTQKMYRVKCCIIIKKLSFLLLNVFWILFIPDFFLYVTDRHQDIKKYLEMIQPNERHLAQW